MIDGVDLNRNKDDQHELKVNAWIDQVSSLPADRLIILYRNTFQVIYKRAVVTLSEVTIEAILDRVVHKIQQRFPFLAQVKIDSKTKPLEVLFSELTDKKPTEMTEVFKFFLIELLTILGNLTAGILTPPLYKELAKIKRESAEESKNRTQNLTQKTRPKIGDDL